MTAYRYKLTTLDAAAIQSSVPVTVTVGPPAPVGFVDITTAAPLAVAEKEDLDAAMLLQGYTFDSTDPVTTPAQAANVANGLVITEVEIDFLTRSRTQKFTIIDATVVATSRIIANQSGVAATGRQSDENEMDALLISCVPGAGQFDVYINALMGPVFGKYKFNYYKLA